MEELSEDAAATGVDIGFSPFARIESPLFILRPTPKVVKDWDEYFGTGDLSDWQRLVSDLGISGHFPSKTKCRKVLKHVWVNIVDFLEDIEAGREPHLFDSQNELSSYTRRTKKFYPKSMMPKGSPLRSLCAQIVNKNTRRRK
ncbi:hypothetical protein F5Y05DRAFT_157947 [Hypoxylon sp. FL0543]|nr:hypothetical protein F5Y05DRAFT_157947 [Hypoxylon sp. FL0543]